MDLKEMEQTLVTLNALAAEQAGQLAAQRVMISAAIATLCQTSPHGLILIRESIDGMANSIRYTVPEQSLKVFDETLGALRRGLATLGD